MVSLAKKEKNHLLDGLRHAIDSELDILKGSFLPGSDDYRKLARYSIPRIKTWISLLLKLQGKEVPLGLVKFRTHDLSLLYYGSDLYKGMPNHVRKSGLEPIEDYIERFGAECLK